VKDAQGQLLWETDTEMTLPDGTLFHSASQCTTRPLCQAGVWLVPNPALRRGGVVTSQVVTTTLGSLRCNTTQKWHLYPVVPTGGAFRRVSRRSPLGELPSSGYGVIEPTGHGRAIYIAVPGAAAAYRLYSVDCLEKARLDNLGYHPTFWKVKAVLIFHAKPAVRAPICVCI
jgi:hypothetical protein